MKLDRERPKRGRKQKTASDPFRAMAHFYALECEVEKELGRRPTATDLSCIFAGHVGAGSKIWCEYKAGRSLPGRGTYKKSEAGLAQAIDMRYPSAAAARDHPIWTLIDRVELELPAIHDLLMQLPVEVSRLLMGRDGLEFRRWYSNPALELPALVAGQSIDHLAAVVALIREAQLMDDMWRSEASLDAMISLLPVLAKTPYTAPFADRLSDYLRSTFKRPWWLAPFMGGDHP